MVETIDTIRKDLQGIEARALGNTSVHRVDGIDCRDARRPRQDPDDGNFERAEKARPLPPFNGLATGERVLINEVLVDEEGAEIVCLAIVPQQGVRNESLVNAYQMPAKALLALAGKSEGRLYKKLLDDYRATIRGIFPDSGGNYYVVYDNEEGQRMLYADTASKDMIGADVVDRLAYKWPAFDRGIALPETAVLGPALLELEREVSALKQGARNLVGTTTTPLPRCFPRLPAGGPARQVTLRLQETAKRGLERKLLERAESLLDSGSTIQKQAETIARLQQELGVARQATIPLEARVESQENKIQELKKLADGYRDRAGSTAVQSLQEVRGLQEKLRGEVSCLP